MIQESEARAIQSQADFLALSFNDPEALAKALAAWIKANFPNRVSAALWITAKKEQDKGISVFLHELKLSDRIKVRVSGLIGEWSAGVSGSADLWKAESGVTISVGLGAVVRYADTQEVSPVATISVRF